MDIFRDLNLYNSNKITLLDESIICEYDTDEGINASDIVTFKDNKVFKATDSNINAIAIENSYNKKVKCQVAGICKLNNFISGSIYYSNNGKLNVENGIEIGKAVSENELLLNNCFIKVENV